MIDPEIGYFANDGVSKKNLVNGIYQVYSTNTTSTVNLVSGSSDDVHKEPHKENQ
jgi:hypothetical protein